MKAEFKNTKKEFEPIEVTITLESMDEAMTLATLLNNPLDRTKMPRDIENEYINDTSLDFWNRIGVKLVQQILTRK
jgi:hypothetical protein